MVFNKYNCIGWTTIGIKKQLSKNPYFGILSNFGFPFWNESIVEQLARSRRDNELRDSFDFWNSGIRRQLRMAEPALQFIEMVEAVAKARPDTWFIVRPHPDESACAWTNILGNRCANVAVEKEGSTHDFLVGAQGVIHSGCTTGFEAFFSQVPCISYCSASDDRSHRSASALVNRLGIVTTNPAEVCVAIEKVRSGTGMDELFSKTGKAEIGQRVYSAGNLGAANRIVDAWEKTSASNDNTCRRWGKAAALLSARELKFLMHRAISKSKFNKKTTEIKFTDLTKQQVLKRFAHIEKRSGIVSPVKAVRLDRQLVLIKSSKKNHA
jgi:hypothetical protein